ncbi:serine-rich adhesin for platelets-like [Watersipora subatra]|uniref:serine-rich adhesin for platelets-like n=1 Tax=Watersipora subatra TaxID=2589382 RepID=UPI00355B3D9C
MWPGPNGSYVGFKNVESEYEGQNDVDEVELLLWVKEINKDSACPCRAYLIKKLFARYSEDLTLIESTTDESAESFLDRSTPEETFMHISVARMASDAWTRCTCYCITNIVFFIYEPNSLPYEAETSSISNPYKMTKNTFQSDLATVSHDEQKETRYSEELALIESTTDESPESYLDRSTVEETFMHISVARMASDAWTSLPYEAETSSISTPYKMTKNTFQSDLATVSHEEQGETSVSDEIPKSSTYNKPELSSATIQKYAAAGSTVSLNDQNYRSLEDESETTSISNDPELTSTTHQSDLATVSIEEQRETSLSEEAPLSSTRNELQLINATIQNNGALDSTNSLEDQKERSHLEKTETSATPDDSELINTTTQSALATVSLENQEETRSSDYLTLIESTTNGSAESFLDRSTFKETFMDISVTGMVSDRWTSLPDEPMTISISNDSELTNTTFESDLATVSLEEQKETSFSDEEKPSSTHNDDDLTSTTPQSELTPVSSQDQKETNLSDEPSISSTYNELELINTTIQNQCEQ